MSWTFPSGAPSSPCGEFAGSAARRRTGRRRRRNVKNGAGNGVRTRDLKLGKLALYQLSYARIMLGCRPELWFRAGTNVGH